jgi:ATP-dependent Clp protease ATP-binding subunit ClpC
MIKGGGTSTFGFKGTTNVEADYEQMKSQLSSELEKHFRPEFINRLDDRIVFRPLTRENLDQIVDYEMKKVHERLAQQEITLELEPSAKNFLIDKGHNPDFGARPLRRAIAQYVEDMLSEAILRSEFKPGSRIKLRHEGENDFLDYTVEEGVNLGKPEDTEEVSQAGAQST